MKEIKLTTGQITLVDDDDYKYLSKRSWRTDKDGYVISGGSLKGIKINFRMHRVILGLTDSNILADHINHNLLDNQKTNLRICNPKENCRNRKPRGRSRYLGVYYQKVKYMTKNGLKEYEKIIARIRYIRDKAEFLGVFDTEEEAAKAYDIAAKKYYGEFANLNFK